MDKWKPLRWRVEQYWRWCQGPAWRCGQTNVASSEFGQMCMRPATLRQQPLLMVDNGPVRRRRGPPRRYIWRNCRHVAPDWCRIDSGAKIGCCAVDPNRSSLWPISKMIEYWNCNKKNWIIKLKPVAPFDKSLPLWRHWRRPQQNPRCWEWKFPRTLQPRISMKHQVVGGYSSRSSRSWWSTNGRANSPQDWVFRTAWWIDPGPKY